MKTIKQFMFFLSISGMLTGCYYDDTEIKQTIDNNKATQDSINIKTLKQQGDAMIQTEQALSELKNTIYTYLSDSLSVEFLNHIEDLQSQIILLNNADDSIVSWVQNTYATLEQYESLSDLLSQTKNELTDAMVDMDSTLRADITVQINALESSMKSWVSSQLHGYYTIVEIDSLLLLEQVNYAALIAKQDSVILDSLSKVNNSLLDSISALRNDITANQVSIDSARAQLTRGYECAISTAITEYDGKINGYIKTQIDSIDNKLCHSIDSIKQDIVSIKQDINAIKLRMDNLEGRIDSLENRVDSVESDVNKLLSQIQSITYLPQYTDGFVKINKVIASKDTTWNSYTDTIKSVIDGHDSLYIPHKEIVRIDTTYAYNSDPIEFLVRPEECVDVINISMLSIKSIAPQIRHASEINANPSAGFEIDSFVKGESVSQKGVIQITLKDNATLRTWYESSNTATIALYIDNDDTNTHVNSGFVVSLMR